MRENVPSSYKVHTFFVEVESPGHLKELLEGLVELELPHRATSQPIEEGLGGVSHAWQKIPGG